MPSAAQTHQVVSPSILRAETNFLRFPFFTLATKNIHCIDFREVTGTRTIQTETGESDVEFTYRVSRNSDHMFPGQLSRNIHFALLSIMSKQGPVPENPIRFSWRQLAREMGVSYGGGKMIDKMKAAIRSTHGTIIRTDQALIDGTIEDRPTLKRERGLHLYADYVFQDEVFTNGATRNHNEVTFSDWYFANLKARYVQPIDFDLWLTLNRETPISSRLYEYLMFVFGKGTFRRISYTKLVAYIPLTPQIQLSRIKNQLAPALAALKNHNVLKRVHWTTGKYGDVILELQKGSAMKVSTSPLGQLDQNEHITETKEGTHDTSPTDRLIKDYYQRRFNSDHDVTAKERHWVAQLVAQHGLEKLSSLLPKLVRQMKQQFPNGVTILAAKPFLEQLLSQPASAPVKDARSPEESLQRRQQKQELRQKLESQWEKLSIEQQEKVHAVVRNRLPKSNESSIGYQVMLLHEADQLFFES